MLSSLLTVRESCVQARPVCVEFAASPVFVQVFSQSPGFSCYQKYPQLTLLVLARHTPEKELYLKEHLHTRMLLHAFTFGPLRLELSEHARHKSERKRRPTITTPLWKSLCTKLNQCNSNKRFFFFHLSVVN